VGINGFGGLGEGSYDRWMEDGMMHRRAPPDMEVCFCTLYFPPSSPYFEIAIGWSLADKPLPISCTGRIVGAMATLAKLVLLEIWSVASEMCIG
jgi:hypothetical protein